MSLSFKSQEISFTSQRNEKEILTSHISNASPEKRNHHQTKRKEKESLTSHISNAPPETTFNAFSQSTKFISFIYFYLLLLAFFSNGIYREVFLKDFLNAKAQSSIHLMSLS